MAQNAGEEGISETIQEKQPTIESEGLKREIGVGGIFINVINNTVGSGYLFITGHHCRCPR